VNLILITVDCLRADHLSCLGYSRKTTPNLDYLAGGGALFTQAISVGPGTPTSFTAMFTSTYPLMYGGKLYITSQRTTMAEVLKEHGYHTAAFHSNPWISSFYGYDRGFDTFDDSIQKWRQKGLLGRPKAIAQRIMDKPGRFYKFLAQVIYLLYMGTNWFSKTEALSKKALSWLRYHPKNSFLWIHYMDVHEPYLPLPGFTSPLKIQRIIQLLAKTRNSPGSLSPQEKKRLVDLYDTKISYADKMIGSLLRILKQSSLLDDTFIIITADHGQQLMERNRHGHSHYLYDELIRVPLIIAGPGVKGQLVSQQISLMDLAPTILDVLKIEKPGSFLGNSLLPLTRGNGAKAGNSEAISEAESPVHRKKVGAGKPRLDANNRRISLRTGKWKYIYTEGGQDELYNLEDDPKETRNVVDIEPGVATRLRARITAHIEFEEKTAPGERERIRAKIRRLKGYV